LDPASAGAEGALAFIAGMRGQWVAGETHIRAELLLNPNDGAAHFGQGGMLLNTGHLHEALEEFKRAHELAPVSAPVAQALAVAYQALGRDTEALKPAQVAVDLGWDEHSLSLFNEQKAFRSGRYADAASAALFALNGADPDQRRAAEVVKLVYGALANPKLRVAANAARQRLYPANPATGGRSVMDTRPCVQSGLLYALLGDLDAAYDLANQCLDSAATGAIAQAPLAKLWMPQMHPFRSDPRFPAFAARLGLIQYWQRYGLPDDCATQAGKLTCE
jgi:tetratricopeptide (TPR) repeat protein